MVNFVGNRKMVLFSDIVGIAILLILEMMMMVMLMIMKRNLTSGNRDLLIHF